jgi:DNA-binding NarL/FixJ family response regulator
MGSISVVLADDHTIVRQGLIALLTAEPDISVVGEAANGSEAVQLVERLQPDILVLDLKMPGMTGIVVMRETGHCSPKTQIIILSMYASVAYVVEAVRGGARAYVLKESTASDLIFAIREVVAGRRYFSPPLSEPDVEAHVMKAKISLSGGLEALTGREREVLQLAAGGKTSAEIAIILSISPRTVEVHRANMMRKLGLHTQVDLIRYALGHGILSPDE